jgi:hypothetical protein
MKTLEERRHPQLLVGRINIVQTAVPLKQSTFDEVPIKIALTLFFLIKVFVFIVHRVH